MMTLVPATAIVKPPVPVSKTPPKPTAPKAPPIVNPYNVPDKVVTPLKAPTLTGQSLRPVPQVNPIKAPPITGYSAIPTPQVTATQTPPITGYSAIPTPQVTGVQTPPMTGYGAVPTPQVTGTQAPPTPQITGIQSPPLVGYGRIPNKPIINVPPKKPQAIPSAQPYLVPSKKSVIAVKTPPVIAAQVPPKIVTNPHAEQHRQPSAKVRQPATHWIVSAQPKSLDKSLQIAARSQQAKIVEPGINSRTVTLYRSEDATEKVYKDIIPMDKTGFFLTVVGIKEPHFSQPKAEFPKVEDESYVFFFDYASIEIYQEQLGQIDLIVQHYQSTGQRVIVMGETDGFGSHEYNAQLAIHRSNKIIDHLLAKGVQAEDIEFKVWVRCCRPEIPTPGAIAATEDQRITWVTFEASGQ
jgi:outer membrane protein OmpA-like peptidoglycan-associated protein